MVSAASDAPKTLAASQERAETHPPKALHGSLAWAWALATALLALFEWALLVKQFPASFSGPGQMAKLLPLTFGNWLPYTLGPLLLWRAASLAHELVSLRLPSSKARLAVAAAFAALSLPYAYWLAKFTFSGPQARVLSLHGPLVAGTTAALSFGFALAVLAAGLRFREALLRRVSALLLACFACGTLWLSRAVMPNEYEPLHAFLALWAVLGASLFGAELARWLKTTSRRLERGGAVALTGIALVSGAHLAVSEDDSWILWSQSAGSRYLTQRWSFLADVDDGDVSDGQFVPRPNLETEQTASWRKRRAERPAPHIVIFSVDGLLPGHVGAYGYTARPTTPNIDRLAKRGVRFNRAFSTFPATKQFNSSLLLGRLIPSHGPSRAPEEFRENAFTRLLDQRDYHTLVKSWFESSARNTFDPAYYKIDTNLPKANARDKKFRLEEPMESRMQRIEEHLLQVKGKQKPVLLWMHLLGTHPVEHEFVPHPRFPFGPSRTERYDSAIAGSDLWLGEVERLMQAHADPERETIWIICSDHGVRVEEAGKDLYAHLVRVPLIIVGRDFEPRVLDEIVETSVDLAATVVDLAGLQPPASYDGISLVPLLMRGDPGSRMPQRVIPLMRGSEWRGAVQGPYKLLRYRKSVSLFDSRSDPEELHNIYSENAELGKAIWRAARQELDRRLAAFQGTKAEVAPSAGATVAELEEDD